MPWTYVGDPQLRDVAATIEDRLHAAFEDAFEDDEVRKATNDRDAWKRFLTKNAKLATDKRAPKWTLLRPLLVDGVRIPGHYILRQKPYAAVYRADEMSKTAKAYLMFHDDDRAETLRKTFAYYLNGTA